MPKPSIYSWKNFKPEHSPNPRQSDISMSESSLSGASVSGALLEGALRGAVQRIWKTNPDNLTVKNIRTSAEHDLDLEDGFFKGDASWNARSKDVIKSEVVFVLSSSFRMIQSLIEHRLPSKQIGNPNRRQSARRYLLRRN